MSSTTPSVSAVLVDADRTAIMAAFTTIKEKLPFLISIPKEDHVRLIHIKDKSVAFDEGCAAYMVSHPSFIPAFVDTAAVLKDRALLASFSEIVREFKTLARSCEDTMTVVSHQVYAADLAYYESVKAAAKRGTLDAEAIADDLGRRFQKNAPASANGSAKPVGAAS